MCKFIEFYKAFYKKKAFGFKKAKDLTKQEMEVIQNKLKNCVHGIYLQNVTANIKMLVKSIKNVKAKDIYIHFRTKWMEIDD